MPRAAWDQGVVSSMVSLRNQFAFWSVQTLPLPAGLCRSGPHTSLADRGNNIESNDLNNSMCEAAHEVKQAVSKDAKGRRRAPIKLDPEV